MDTIQPLSVIEAASEATKRLALALAIKEENQQDCDFLEGYNKGYNHGVEWQKEQDKDKLFTYADMQAAFEAGKDYGDVNARFWNTDGVSRIEYDKIEDFEVWIKSYKP